MELMFSNVLLVGSFLVLLSVIFSKFSEKLGLPILIVFMFIGMIAGSDGLGGIYFENYELTYCLSLVSICFIIFSGAIETDFKEVKESLGRGITLSSLGIVITTAITGIFVTFITNLDIIKSLLVGAILSATDAAFVFSIFKDDSQNISPKIKGLLKFESSSNDAMAYFLVVVLLGYLNTTSVTMASTLINVLLNPFVGGVFGWLIARLFIYTNNIINLSYIGLYPALTLAFLFLSFSLSNLFHGNGFLAVYIFGITISNQSVLHKKFLQSFYDVICWLSQLLMFVILGLLVFPSRLMSVSSTGIMISIFLMIVARPIATFICLGFGKYTFRDKIFVSWAGLKGATPIVFACLAAIRIGDEAHQIFDIVFFVVLTSALFQAMSLKYLAEKLAD